MPLVVIPTLSGQNLEDLAERRWEAVLTARPELPAKSFTRRRDFSWAFRFLSVSGYPAALARFASSMDADPLLAQSAVDWLLNSAYELVLDGDSYRRRQKPRGQAPSASTEVSQVSGL